VPKGISSKFPNNKDRFRIDDMVAMVGAAQAGLGVVRLPMFLGRATAGLVQVTVLGRPGEWPSAGRRSRRL
jgi:DNA-binding transcriptional LysR family regulator